MAAGKNPPADPTAAREIGTTRTVAATPEQLFAAFSDPARLTQWWGPKNFTSTFHEFDLRPGGKWRLVLHGPDGTDYPNEKEFVAVTKPARIVLRNVSQTHGFEMTIAFTARERGTLITWRLLFDSAAECARVRAIVTEANEQNLDRFEAHVRTSLRQP
jgi:uncharacterized protein YndB with AHSA1/START domain